MDNAFRNCVFIGNFFNQNMIDKYSKYTTLSIGNDNYEKHFIKILDNVFENVICFSAPALPKASFKFPFLFIKKDFEITGKIEKHYIPFLNSRFACNKENNLFKEISKVLVSGELNYVFISTYHHASLIKRIKQKYPNTYLVLLIPDLPNISVSEQSLFARKYIKNITKIFFESLQFVDLILPITNKQLEQLPNYKNDRFIYETYFEAGLFDSIIVEKKNQILYAGSLSKAYGVLDLIEQFKKAKTLNCQLVICGKGDCEKEVANLANDSEHIIYLGLVSKEKVYELEKQSLLIVCPDKESRPYSFHSRYLEYLASGTPILTFRPEGAKEEYLQFFNLVEDYGGDLSVALEKILINDYDNALKKAYKAKDFIRNQKSCDVFSKELVKKINDFNKK